jgi:hypothetical protein
VGKIRQGQPVRMTEKMALTMWRGDHVRGRRCLDVGGMGCRVGHVVDLRWVG